MDSPPHTGGDVEAKLLAEQGVPEEDENESIVTVNGATSSRVPTAVVKEKPSKKKATITRGMWLLQGSYLPMFSDKVRNSVRSRLLLVLIYVFAAAVIAGFIVANFYVREVTRLQLEFYVSPREEFQAGLPFDPFSIQVTDQHSRPQSGVKTYLTMVPVDDVTLSVQIGTSVFETETYRCMQATLFPMTMDYDAKLPLCAPQSAKYPNTPLLTGRLSETNGDGIAHYDAVKMHTAVPGTYLMLAGVLTCSKDEPGEEMCTAVPSLFLSKYMTTTLEVLEMAIVNVSVPKDAAPPGTVLPQFIYLDVHSPTAGAPHAGASDEYFAGLTGVGAFVNVTFMAPKMPETVTGIARGLKLMNSPLPRSNMVPYMPTQTNTPTITVGNAYSVASKITKVKPGVFNAILTFKNIVVLSTNAKEVYLGVYCLGHQIPLLPPGFYGEMQRPEALVLPFTMRTPVSQIVLIKSPFVSANTNEHKVQEGDPLNVVVQILDDRGNAVVGREAFLEITPAATNPAMAYNQAAHHPAIDPKRMIFNKLVSDEDGYVQFSGARPTVNHACGKYNIRVSCDGVDMLVEGKTSIPVDIVSSVAKVELTEYDNGMDGEGALHKEEEIVNKEWQRVPTVKIMKHNGDPIPVKTAVLRVKNATNAAVHARATHSTELGISSFFSVRVLFARNTSAPIEFEVLVDNIVFATFTRRIRHQDATLPNPVSSLRKPSFVEFVDVPLHAYSGRTYSVMTRLYNEFGQPVSGGTVRIAIGAEYVLPLAGRSTTEYNLTTNASGYVAVGTGFGPSLSHFSLIANFYAGDDDTTAFPLVFTYISRIKNVNATFGQDAQNNDTTMHMIIDVDAEWDAIDEEFPLLVSAAPVWQPTFVVEGSRPATQQVVVVNASQMPVKLYLHNAVPPYPGLYYYAPSLKAGHKNPLTKEVDGGNSTSTMFLPAVPVPIMPFMKSLKIVQSAITTSNGTINPLLVGKNLAVQPSIAIFSDKEQWYPLAGVRMIAQVGLTNISAPAGDARATTWLNPYKRHNEAQIEFGLLAFPTSPPSGSDGVATFTTLNFIGLKLVPGMRHTLRYCAYIDTVDLATFGLDSLCVEETSHFGELETFSRVSLSTNRISTTPGGILPPIVVKSYLVEDGVHSKNKAAYSACMLRMLVTPPNYLERTALFASQGVLFLMSENTPGPPDEITTQGAYSLSKDAPDGTYDLQFLCIGAVSETVRLTVTSIPGSIEVLQAPPSTLTMDRLVSFKTQLFATSGTPLYGALQLSVEHHPESLETLKENAIDTGREVMIEKDENHVDKSDIQQTAVKEGRSVVESEVCQREACGVLAATSTAFTSTDIETGMANFQFALKAAKQGTYQIKITVAPLISPAGTVQNVNSDIADISGIFGVGRNELDGWLSAVSLSGNEVLDHMLRVQIQEVLRILFSLSETTMKRSSDSQADEFLSTYFSKLKPVIATATVFIPNPVHAITVEQQPKFDFSFPAETVFSAGTGSKLGDSASITKKLTGDSAIRVKLFNATSSVLLTKVLTVTILPENSGGTVINSNQDEWYFDGDELVLEGLELAFSSPGKYRFALSSNGGGMTTTDFVHLSQAVGKSLTEVMKESAFGLALIFSPLLLATVPHNRLGFQICGAVFGVGLFIVASFSTGQLDVTTDRYMWSYTLMVIVLAMMVGLLQLIVFVVSVVATYFKQYKMRIFNDEDKAFKVFEYARWITNVRVDNQESSDDDDDDDGKPSIIDRVKTKHVAVKEKLNKNLEVEMFDLKPTRTIINRERKPLKYDKKIDATFLPINYLIVCGITVVFTGVVTFLMVWLYSQVMSSSGQVISTLPQATNSTTLKRANDAFIAVTQESLLALSHTYPDYQFLANWAEKLEGKNVLQSLANLRDFLEKCVQQLNMAFIIGCVTADLAIVACMISVLLAIPPMIRDIRRGVLQRDGAAGIGESYIGLHCFHFIMAHQLIFWPVVLIVLILAIAPIRIFVWTKLQVIIIASITSLLIQVFLQKVLVAMFLTDTWRILRPEFYSIWHFVGLILGVFTGLAKSIARYVQGIVFITVLFPRLDFTIFPVLFASIDVANAGFYSVVLVEAKNNNPIGLLWSTLILLEAKCRALAASGFARVEIDAFGDQKINEVVIDNDGDGSAPQQEDPCACCQTIISSAQVKNLCRVTLRSWVKGNDPHLNVEPTEPYFDLSHYNDSEEDLTGSAGPSKRRSVQERIRNRWWLLWLLHANPSLRKLRKRYLYEEHHHNLDEQEHRKDD